MSASRYTIVNLINKFHKLAHNKKNVHFKHFEPDFFFVRVCVFLIRFAMNDRMHKDWLLQKEHWESTEFINWPSWARVFLFYFKKKKNHFLQVSDVSEEFADVVIINLEHFVPVRQDLDGGYALLLVPLDQFADLRKPKYGKLSDF